MRDKEMRDKKMRDKKMRDFSEFPVNVSFILFLHLNLFNRINQSISCVKAGTSPCNSRRLRLRI